MDRKEQRELEAWIAEHVMAWKETKEPDDFTEKEEIVFYKHAAHGESEWRVVVGRPYLVRHAKGVRKYSHSYSNFYPTQVHGECVNILEKCRDRAAKLGDHSIRIIMWDDSITISLVDNEMMSNKHTTAAETLEKLPEAICLFAKKLFTE